MSAQPARNPPTASTLPPSPLWPRSVTRTSIFIHQSKVVADRRLTQAQVLRELPDGHLLARTVIDHAGQSESGRVGIEPQRLRERFRGRVRGSDVLEVSRAPRTR